MGAYVLLFTFLSGKRMFMKVGGIWLSITISK